MTGEDLHAVELPHSPRAVALARDWVSEALGDGSVLEAGEQANVEVMVSELVANVIKHTSSRPLLSVRCDDEQVVVEVEDDDPGRPVVRPLDPRRVGGNGLRIVDAWAECWGVRTRDDDGKVVWFAVRAG
jgi:anti-sigma regulatory factor (Ser/Thr protein kinase)